jgi:hypothetical protein
MATIKKPMAKRAMSMMKKKSAPKKAAPMMSSPAMGAPSPMMKKGGKMKKAQTGTTTKKATPTYKNLPMGVANERYQVSGEYRGDAKPTSRDSARYRGGFEQGLKGMKGGPNEGQVEKMGRWEGQNAGKPKPKPKQKTGGVTKKKTMKMGGKMSKKK